MAKTRQDLHWSQEMPKPALFCGPRRCYWFRCGASHGQEEAKVSESQQFPCDILRERRALPPRIKEVRMKSLSEKQGRCPAMRALHGRRRRHLNDCQVSALTSQKHPPFVDASSLCHVVTEAHGATKQVWAQVLKKCSKPQEIKSRKSDCVPNG